MVSPELLVVTLFQIPPPSTWTVGQVANSIQIVVAIGTVGTLVYVVMQGKQNTRNIDALAKMAVALDNQYKIDREKNRKLFAPIFKMSNSSPFHSNPKQCSFTIQNNGHAANVTRFHFYEVDVEFDNMEVPRKVQRHSGITSILPLKQIKRLKNAVGEFLFITMIDLKIIIS